MSTLSRSVLAVVILSLGLSLGCRHPDRQGAADAGLRVGAAEIDITPPVGYRLAGYFNERISTGVHDPLQAKAVVLRQGPEQIALVCCDLLGFGLPVTSKARAQASELTGIPVTNIVLCATHTHTGPLFDGALREYFHAEAVEKLGSDPHETVDYPALLVERLVKVIVEAQSHLQPAELQVGITKQEGITFNRRFWMKNGKVVFNPGQLNPDIVRPAGPTDTDLGIVLARRPAAPEPFYGLTVFAVHSDTTSGTLIGADYEYFLQETLRQKFGGDFISAFGLGTCGDLNHINVSKKEPTTGYPVPRRIGTTLGDTVLAAAPGLPVMRKPSLAVRSATLQIPLHDVTPEEVADARAVMQKFYDTNVSFLTKVAAVRSLDLAALKPIRPMEVQVLRLDADTAIVCLPCEIFVELGLAIKHASPFRNTLVIEICNDRPSYVPTAKAFGEGSYEVTNARVKPGAGEKLVAAAVELLKQVKE